MASGRFRSLVVPAWLAVIVVGLSAVSLSAFGSGFDDIASHPAIVLPMATASLVLLASARGIRAAPSRRLLLAAGIAMVGYVAVTAGSAWYGAHLDRRDAVTQVLVAAQALGWVLPVILMTGTYLISLVVVGAAGARTRSLIAVLVGYTLLAFVPTLLTSPPPDDTAAAALGPLVTDPFLTFLGGVAPVPSLVVVVLTPVATWRAVARVTGHARQRAVGIALASLVTPVAIVYCLAMTVLYYVAGALSTTVGAITLSLAFFGSFVVAAPLVARALGPTPPPLPAPRALSLMLAVGVGLPLFIVAVTLGWLAAERVGPAGLAFVVIGVLALGGLTAATRRRVVGILLRLIDPARDRTAVAVREVSRLTPAASLQEVARRALRNPGIIVSLRLSGGGWVHVDGTPAPAPATPVTGDAHIEPLTPDAASVLDEASDLVDRAVLELAVRAQEKELAIARAEAEEARATERRRLERDLHDGVQGRLLALALDLRVSQRSLADGDAHLVIADAIDGLGRAIDELRSLTQGGGPALLASSGLRAALAEFTGRLPVDVTLVRAPERLPPAAESVVYLVVCEAVTNALKHAQADSVEIQVDVVDDVAVVRVCDDGVGGADLRAGTGLRGLSERVSTMGGRLLVSERSPSGTLLEVAVPCGS
jgi:signal transduction histidine kinase